MHPTSDTVILYVAPPEDTPSHSTEMSSSSCGEVF